MPGPSEPIISNKARAIAEGLIRTRRAEKSIKIENEMLRLRALREGFYWVSLDGARVLRGTMISEADELQPKFIDAMERAGR